MMTERDGWRMFMAGMGAGMIFTGFVVFSVILFQTSEERRLGFRQGVCERSDRGPAVTALCKQWGLE